MVELCKVKHDGSHYVATPYRPSHKKNAMRDTSESEWDIFFDTSFEISSAKGLKSLEQREFIIEQMQAKFGVQEQIPDFVYKRHIKKMHAMHERLKRFYDIVYLNHWTHFVTFTYDDKKHTEDTFEAKLKKTFQNLHTRHSWKYCGVFERSPEEERKHFHGLFNIPNMVGEIEEKKDYSTKTHSMQITHSNTYFLKRFGRNDFEEINQEELKYGNTLNYITKYIVKQNQKIVYSRGLQSPKYCLIAEGDITSEFDDYGLRYALYDDFDIHNTNIEIANPFEHGDLEYPSYYGKELIEQLKQAKEYESKGYGEGLKKWFELRYGKQKQSSNN